MQTNDGKAIGAILRRRCVEQSSPSQHSYEDAFKHYGLVCPAVIASLGCEFQGGFVERFPGEDCHFYSPDDLMKAELHVPIDVRENGIVPLADCKDNMFLCCMPMKSRYALYSPLDDTVAYSSESLKDVLSKLGIE